MAFAPGNLPADTGERDPAVGNFFGDLDVAHRQHRRAGNFTALSLFPFRRPTERAVLVSDLGCDLKALLSPDFRVGNGQFGQAGAWKSAA